MSRHDTIVATRTDSGPPETDEIRALVAAAGHAVVGEVTQVRAEDSGTYLGSGKAEELAGRVSETGAGTVVVDGELTPSQHYALAEAMPPDTVLRDRYRLVLDVFSEQAGTRRAQLQVELAQLRYDLPRMEASADEGMLNKRVEKGSPIYDARDRIDRLEGKLDDLPDPTERFRERRREEGFDLLTLAGYTNAGKSTLLHRLADDLDLADAELAGTDSGDPESGHSDRDTTAAVADRLFETLETTTRRATIGDRPVLVTDTVGFVADLPHWLVESFSATLSEASTADAVVLVADASDPPAELREKLQVSLGVLDAQGVERESILTALNKVDLLDERERERRVAAAAEVAPSPLPVSVLEGSNVDELCERIAEHLPTERAAIEMSYGSDAMSLVSWAYDHAGVETVEYADDTVRLVVSGRPGIVAQLRAKADAIGRVPVEADEP